MSDAELDELYKTAKERERFKKWLMIYLIKENSQNSRFSKYLKEGIEIYLRDFKYK
jgi:hypothetical protein